MFRTVTMGGGYQHIVFLTTHYFILSNSQQKSDLQQILNQVGTKMALETIMNTELFQREEAAESNEIS